MESEIVEMVATPARLAAVLGEIHRLETALTQSPNDAFGYLELGCLFAEVAQRDAAILAFRQSYVHRMGGADIGSAELPAVDGQLQEAFDVAVSQTPDRRRGQTRELFELAVRQERRAVAHPVLAAVGSTVLVVLMGLAAIAGSPLAQAHQGYWPSFFLQQPALAPPAATSGYWPAVKHW